MHKKMLVLSHAACKGHAPENTLAGIRAALALGADAVEVDVRATADGIPVLLHDATVDRTTDGSGPLSAMTFAETRKLNAGDERFPGERVPSLEETVQAAGEMALFLELKETGIERAVLDVIRKTDSIERCTINSFLGDALTAMRHLEPRLPYVLTVAGRPDDWDELLTRALSLNAQGLSVECSLVDGALIEKTLRRAMRVYSWTVNEESEMLRLIGLGVDGIISDFPDRVREALVHRPWP
ncbi:MAG: glycerophosphodiester phosphodiesterase family protein [Dehalococcoidia bacterium]|nr:glycerophosphodiester phosphodiesterase family protein [Dehalococcoidia bacterium]